MKLPIWMYWEGHRPEWISMCERTVRAHADDVRVLSPEDFDLIRDCDRDIDLSGLCVAHRADFIRSYLLRRHGGLWIDSDCIVIKDLQPWLNRLAKYEFIGYKERQQHVANNFMAARPRSPIAREYYWRVCSLLRSRAPLSWLTLGSDALTRVLKELKRPWLQIGYELVQPICWSQPELFFAIRAQDEHAAVFNERSICYMLANQVLTRYSQANPTSSLTDEGTFFQYIYNRAVAGGSSVPETRSLMAAPSRSWRHIPFCEEMIRAIMPLNVLDTEIGFGVWGMVVREICERRHGQIHRENWRVSIEGIASSPARVEEYHHHFYSWIHIGEPRAILAASSTRWDLAFVSNVQSLVPAMEKSDYVLMVLPIAASERFDRLAHLPIPPARSCFFDEPGDSGYGVFVFSLKDPMSLGRPDT
jgi:hypothetical protein